MSTLDRGVKSPQNVITESGALTAQAAAIETAAAARQEILANQIASFQTPAVLAALRPALTVGDVAPQQLSDLEQLFNKPPRLRSQASAAMDGRLVRLVLATVRDRNGQSRAGIPLELWDSAQPTPQLVDTSYSDPNGLVLLKFPHPANGMATGSSPVTVADLPAIQGTVKVIDGTPTGAHAPVTIPAATQSTSLLVQLPTLPTNPAGIVSAATSATATNAGSPASGVGLPRGDDPLSRLPANFSTDLCRQIEDQRSRIPDPILGSVKGIAADDFRGHRTPILRHLAMPRLGDPGDVTETGANTQIPRYIVRLRQTWVFLGYTLGELSGVDSLDPGQIVDDATQTVERSLDQASRVLDTLTQETRSALSDTLRSMSSIDAVAHLQNSVEAKASAFGWGVGIPGLFGVGGVDAKASVSTDTLATSSLDTSLEVARLVNTATSAVNNAIRSTTAQTLEEARNLSRTISNVSPLLSRVTNLLRWNLYENYAVCTEVEDVHEVKAFNLFEKLPSAEPANGVTPPFKIGGHDGFPGFDVPGLDYVTPPPAPPTFDAETVVDLRPFLQPRLLEQRLVPHFDVLAQAVDDNANGGRAITYLELEVGYSLNLGSATLTASVAGIDTVVPLRMGGSRARARIALPYPMRAAEIQLITFSLASNALDSEIFLKDLGIDITQVHDIRVNRIRIWAGKSPAQPADFDVSGSTPGMSSLRIQGLGSVDPVDFTLLIRPLIVDITHDPLYRHVNRNKTYYLGVLAEAALHYPSLRDDVVQIASVYPGTSKLWELPILGFEGDRVLVLKDVDATDRFAATLLSDPGTATLVQVLAPGAYSEALQGLLELTDARGRLHPKLANPTELLVPGSPPVDLTGKTLTVVESAVNGSGAPLPSGNGAGMLPGH